MNDINYGQILESLNNKADRDLNNISGGGSGLNNNGIRTIVETWNEGHNWYRIWSDGWIEQGGNIPFSATGGWTSGNITFFKPFSNINYSINGRGNWSERHCCDFGINSKTSTGCNVTLAINRYYGEENGMWRAEGY